MNRELKFRAWSNVFNEFIYMEIQGNFTSIYSEDRDTVGDLPSYIKWEQFIGEKDNQGKEIYENDIVDWFGWDGDNEIEGIDFIAFSECSFNIENESGYVFSLDQPLHNKGIKVIGNIHQNPELLTPKQ